MSEGTILLFSAGLLSKWGFKDGDLLYDLLWEHDMRDGDLAHAVLCVVVRERLLPALDQAVEVQEIGTIHNPIRARTVDGVDVTGEWHSVEHHTPLTPTSVAVPKADILAIARRILAAPPTT